MKILEINKDNEVLEIHHGNNGYFVIMGTKGKTTEMNLSTQDVAKIKNAFTKSKLPKESSKFTKNKK